MTAKATVIAERFAGSFIALGGIFMVICGGSLVYQGANLSEKLPPVMIIALGFLVCRQGIRRARHGSESEKTLNGPLDSQSVEDRLDELERLKRRDMVTPEEYTMKRQEILKDL